jgi:hypothetical protein
MTALQTELSNNIMLLVKSNINAQKMLFYSLIKISAVASAPSADVNAFSGALHVTPLCL